MISFSVIIHLAVFILLFKANNANLVQCKNKLEKLKTCSQSFIKNSGYSSDPNDLDSFVKYISQKSPKNVNICTAVEKTIHCFGFDFINCTTIANILSLGLTLKEATVPYVIREIAIKCQQQKENIRIADCFDKVFSDSKIQRWECLKTVKDQVTKDPQGLCKYGEQYLNCLVNPFSVCGEKVEKVVCSFFKERLLEIMPNCNLNCLQSSAPNKVNKEKIKPETETGIAKPETMEKPNINSGKEVTKTGKQLTSTGKPETAAGKPETVTGKPETVTGKPETATGKPETVTGKPEMETGKQGTPPGKPETATGKPETATGKTEMEAGKQGTLSGKPETATGKPETATEKPETVTGKPEMEAGKQGTPPGKPETATGKPETVTGKPETATGKPETATGKTEMEAGKQGTLSGKPETATGKPEMEAGKQGTPSEKPETATGKPEMEAGKQGTPSGKPETATGKPEMEAGKQGTPPGKPETATGKREIEAGKQGTPPGKPEMEAGKQGTPSGKPETATGKPEMEAGKQGTPSGKPETATGKPEMEAGKQGTPPGKPETATGKPEMEAGKQGTPSGKPETATGKPEMEAGKQGTPPGKPETATGKPEMEAGKRETATGNPEAATGKPETATGKPEMEAGKQGTPSEKPETATGKPEMEAGKPETETETGITRAERAKLKGVAENATSDEAQQYMDSLEQCINKTNTDSNDNEQCLKTFGEETKKDPLGFCKYQEKMINCTVNQVSACGHDAQLIMCALIAQELDNKGSDMPIKCPVKCGDINTAVTNSTEVNPEIESILFKKPETEKLSASAENASSAEKAQKLMESMDCMSEIDSNNGEECSKTFEDGVKKDPMGFCKYQQEMINCMVSPFGACGQEAQQMMCSSMAQGIKKENNVLSSKCTIKCGISN